MQRAIFYADSLFETIRVFDHRIPLLNAHVARLRKGMKAVGMEVPEHWNAPFFYKEITEVAPPNARVRLTVFRSPGGLYLPEDNTPQWMLTTAELPSARLEWSEKPIQLGICQRVRLPVDDFSNFKTLNAARYVQAAIEAREQGWNDGLVLNAYGRIAEATSSNVFWWKDGQLFTPPLSEGCVAGVMRDVVLQTALKNSITTTTLPLSPEQVLLADELFLTNAIRCIMPAQMAGTQTGHERSLALFEQVCAQIFDDL